jgi:hypothetical protein
VLQFQSQDYIFLDRPPLQHSRILKDEAHQGAHCPASCHLRAPAVRQGFNPSVYAGIGVNNRCAEWPRVPRSHRPACKRRERGHAIQIDCGIGNAALCARASSGWRSNSVGDDSHI